MSVKTLGINFILKGGIAVAYIAFQSKIMVLTNGMFRPSLNINLASNVKYFGSVFGILSNDLYPASSLPKYVL